MGTSKKRQWTEEQARKVVAAWEKSGLPVSRYEREMGLSSNRLRCWRRRFKKPQARGKSVALVPVVVRAEPSSSMVKLNVPGDFSIEVADAGLVTAQWVAAVARELARVG